MAEKTFYDEMVECLRLVRRNSPSVSVSGEVLAEFMTDIPRRKKSPAEAEPVERYAVRTPPPAVETNAVSTWNN